MMHLLVSELYSGHSVNITRWCYWYNILWKLQEWSYWSYRNAPLSVYS